jgi:hypothetical protein
LANQHLEKLDLGTINELARELRGIQVSIRYRERRSHWYQIIKNHQQDTTALVILCYYLGLPVFCSKKDGMRLDRSIDESAELMAKFAINDAERVVTDILAIGPGIWDSTHIAWYLKLAMTYILDLPISNSKEIHVKVKEEIDLCQTGCRLIATYQDNVTQFMANHHDEQDEKALGDRLGNLKLNSGICQDMFSPHYKQVYVKNGRTDDCISKIGQIVFADRQLRTRPEPFGWVVGMMLEGCGQYVDELKYRTDSRINHTSTALSFVFSIAGFIPMAGEFSGIVGLLANTTLTHFWKSADLRPLIVSLDGHIQTSLDNMQKDILAKAGPNQAIESRITEILRVMERTQKNGKQVQEERSLMFKMMRWGRLHVFTLPWRD